ncbi:MAG: hypothetical protein ACR2H0_02960 [Candidatus Limnocylindrales bacterium]
MSAFYLRAWYTQALPPPSTFTWLPMLTINDGIVIDGNVAVPAIYPGPMLIVPFSRTISEAGIAAIIGEARRLGLLGEVTDFTGGSALPGSRVGQLRLVVDGVTYDLVGNPDLVVPCGGGRCEAQQGSPQAFAAFWQELTFLDPWLGSELGATGQHEPERVAVLFTDPARPEPGLEQRLATWPLDGTFHEIGVELPGVDGARCVTLSEHDLEAVLPVLMGANQLTVFNDTVDTFKSALAVVLVPGADSPCPDQT